MTGDRADGNERGRIEGYRVWRGRKLLHARFRGTLAEARAAGRPWHVVAPTLTELIREAHRRADENRWSAW